ncbi:MAG: sigma-70 family RNA polymerase sigma factor [Myxococcota bacterium]
MLQNASFAKAEKKKKSGPRLVVDSGRAERKMNEPLTDKVLVERAARGDEIAFSELVNRHYKRALRVSFGLLKDRHDAEDVVQDAFARVHKRLKDFEGQSAFYTWLYRIVVNLSIDYMRKRKRERRVDVEDESAREALRGGEELWPRYSDSDPGDSMERVQLRQKLQLAFQDLPEIHQAVLMLRELEGFSYEEIATTLNIKKGTVMSRLFHARKAMQTRMTELMSEDGRSQEGR